MFALVDRLVPYLLSFLPDRLRFQFCLFLNLNFEVLADQVLQSVCLVISYEEILHILPRLQRFLDGIFGHLFIGAVFHERVVLLDFIFESHC